MARAAARPPASTPQPPRVPAWVWPLAIPLALLALLWSCRSALLGTAVADDYSFLAQLAFHRPLEWFDSMGAAFYWRPVSRQFYFLLAGPWLLGSPWLAAAMHLALLAGTAALLYRIARRFVSAPVAAAVAVFPLVSEPARVLLTWPSGAQHLLAGAMATLAVHEAVCGRLATGALAALAGVLSHESAALALPVLPLVAWGRTRLPRDAVRGALAAVAVAALWATGYAVALGHGIHMPAGGAAGALLSRLPSLGGRALLAALNVEDLGSPAGEMLLTGYVALALVATVTLAGRGKHARLRDAAPALLAGAAWFAIGVLPLALLLPDWNAWRAWTPTLGFALATAALLGLASPWLAGGWIALKLVALLLSPVAPSTVSSVPPVNRSHESFAQITRLQRLVSGTRRALVQHYPTLPKGAAVCFWEIPRLAEFAFQGSRALQVWYGDSTLVWDRFGGAQGLSRRFDAAIEFLPEDRDIALAVDVRAVTLYQRGAGAMNGRRLDEADSLLLLAERTQRPRRGKFLASVINNRLRIALMRGDVAAADSLFQVADSFGLRLEDRYALCAVLALAHGNRDEALKAARELLRLAPEHPDAQMIARSLGLER